MINRWLKQIINDHILLWNNIFLIKLIARIIPPMLLFTLAIPTIWVYSIRVDIPGVEIVSRAPEKTHLLFNWFTTTFMAILYSRKSPTVYARDRGYLREIPMNVESNYSRRTINTREVTTGRPPYCGRPRRGNSSRGGTLEGSDQGERE